MSIVDERLKALSLYAVEELKLVYRVLHRNLADEPDLMDTALMADLQAHLHQLATAAGIDVTDHAALDRWMGNRAGSCAERVARRVQPQGGLNRTN